MELYLPTSFFDSFDSWIDSAQQFTEATELQGRKTELGLEYEIRLKIDPKLKTEQRLYFF